MGCTRPPPQLSRIYNYCGPSNLTPHPARSTNTECDRNFMLISFINIRGGLPYFAAIAVLFIHFPSLNVRNRHRTYYYDIFIILLQYQLPPLQTSTAMYYETIIIRSRHLISILCVTTIEYCAENLNGCEDHRYTQLTRFRGRVWGGPLIVAANFQNVDDENLFCVRQEVFFVTAISLIS